MADKPAVALGASDWVGVGVGVGGWSVVCRNGQLEKFRRGRGPREAWVSHELSLQSQIH